MDNEEITSDEEDSCGEVNNLNKKSPVTVSSHSRNAIVLGEQLFKARFRFQRVQELLNELILVTTNNISNLKKNEYTILSHADQQLSSCVTFLTNIVTESTQSSNSEVFACSCAQAEAVLALQHKKHVVERSAVLSKWHQRSNLFGGAFGSNMVGGRRNPCELIDSVLADKERVLRRTQINRLQINNREAESANSTRYHVEIFDDSDFYRFLLEAFLHAKTKDISNPVHLGMEFAKLNELRTFRKKHVDKRASKARKLRFGVMPKLVNFAAPGLLKLSTNGVIYESEKQRILTDCEKDALYKNLFGGRTVTVK